MTLSKDQKASLLNMVTELEKEIQLRYGGDIRLRVDGVVIEMYKMDEIITSSCIANRITKEMLLAKGRSSWHIDAVRKAVILLCRKYTNNSFEKIGFVLRRHGSSIIHACQNGIDLLEAKDILLMEVYQRSFDYLKSNYSK